MQSSMVFSDDMVRAVLRRRMTEIRIPCRGESSKWRLPYKSGDSIWVKEEYSDQFDNLPVVYRADFPLEHNNNYISGDYFKWKIPNSLPRELSRITLHVIDVRIERLQTIDSVSAMNAGIANDFFEVNGRVLVLGFYNYQYNEMNGLKQYFDNPIDSYRSFWDSLYNMNFPWKSNPYTYLIKFYTII